MFEWIIVGAMLGGAGAGAAVTLTRRRRRRADALAIAGAVARQKAFEHAEVIVHEVERLSLAETQYAGGVDADSPYEFRAELTVRPAGELDWNPLELALVAEPVATGYLDLGPVVRLTSVEVLRAPDGAPASRGPQRLRLTFRTQSPSSRVKLEYGGAVFGCIGTMGVAVVSQRPIPASLRAPAVALAVPAPSRRSGPSLASLAHASAPKEHVVDGLWDAPSAVPASKVSPSPTFGPSKFAAPPGPERPTALSALDDLLFRPELQGIVPAGTAMLGGSSAAPRKARPKPAPPPAVAPLSPTVHRPRVVFDIYSRSGEHFDVPPIAGLDEAAWRPVSKGGGASSDPISRGLFDVDAILRDSTEPPSAESASLLRAADHVHRVIIERASLLDATHIAEGLTTAASIAKEVGGVIRDAVSGRFLTPEKARRILKARRFSIVDHVVVTSRPDVAPSGGGTSSALLLRTRGLTKFGTPELEVSLVPKEHLRTVRQALLTLADLRSNGTELTPGSVIQLGPAPLVLVPTAHGTLAVTDADALTHAPSSGLQLWLDAVTLAA